MQSARAATATARACSDHPLGQATGFNLFVLGDLAQSGSDTEGRMAVRGDATLTDYSIGAALSSVGPRETLVVGGSLDFRRGALAVGDAVSGGRETLNNVSFAPSAGYRRAAPIDFDRAERELRDIAAAYGALPTSGSTSLEYGRLVLVGSDPDLNVFGVSAADLTSANSLIVRAPLDSTILVNIGGDVVQFGNIGFDLGGIRQTKVLYNFAEATSLTLHGLGVRGSVLAPRAGITFRDGIVDGTIIGASLSGSGQMDLAPFSGCIAPR